MKRLAMALLLIQILCLPSPVAARPAPDTSLSPRIERWNVEEFYADFDYRENGKLYSYMVIARLVRDADNGDVIKKQIYAGKLPCQDLGDQGADCGGRMSRQTIVEWNSSDTFDEATLVFRGEGLTSSLHFNADRPYQASGTEQGSECYGTFVYQAANNAYVTGRLLGRRVDTRKDEDRSLETMERYVRLAACM